MQQHKASAGLGRLAGLLPALSVRQWVLLLPRDEGGTPHGTAVAVPEPAHSGWWWWVGGAPETMVRLCLCGERWGWAPHCQRDKKVVSKCSLISGSIGFVFPATQSWPGIQRCNGRQKVKISKDIKNVYIKIKLNIPYCQVGAQSTDPDAAAGLRCVKL